MRQDNVTHTGEVLFSLIEKTYGSDAAFERAANLPPKTVNNWRRGRSASYMKLLPELAALFGVSVRDLVDTESEAPATLSREEQELLTMFRGARGLTEKERTALTETIRNTIDLYLSSRGNGK